MGKTTRSVLAFAAGTSLGGLFVGALEAMYRDVSVFYAALLYGAIWALVGFGGAAAARIVYSSISVHLFAWGLSLSSGLSTVVLARFILLRDFLGEAPGGGAKATVGALVLGVVVGVALFVLGRMVRVFDKRGPAFAAPVLVLGAFALAAQGSGTTKHLASGSVTSAPVSGVILIVVDTLRADALGAYGSPRATPNLDAFAKKNLLFKDMSAQASWTKPAMASLMTSRHASGHNTMSKTDALPGDLTTLAESLRSSGIQTAAVVTNYNLEESFGFDQGFDQYDYLPPDRYLGAPPRANRLAAYNVYRVLRERFLPGKREARHFYQEAPTVNQRGLRLLDSMDPSKPFFLWLHYMEPHDPYFAADGTSIARVSTPNPEPSLAEPMKNAYHEDVQRFDQAFGQLLQEFDKRNLQNVAIVLTSDHGEEFNEHGGFYHGVTLYEEQLELPLLIRKPGAHSEVRSDLARQIDIAPTIAGLFDVVAPSEWEGRDLLGQSAVPEHTIAEEDHQGNILTSIRQTATPQLKLILANDRNPRGLSPAELYDLSADPQEKHLLKQDTQALRTALRNQQTASEKGGVLAQKRELDAEAEAELRSLGYME